MASHYDAARSGRRRSSSTVDHHEYPLDNIKSNTSSNVSVPRDGVFSEGSRSRSNTPSSLASSVNATSPESIKHALDNSQASSSSPALHPAVSHIRSSSHCSNTSRPSPSLLHADAVNSGHHASQTLETIPQAALPPPVIDPADGESQRVAVGAGETSLASSSAQEQISNNATEPAQADASSGNGGALLVRADTGLSWATALAHTFHARARQYRASQVSYGLTTLVVSILGTAMIAYRGYVISKWQALHDYYDFCRQITPKYPQYDSCQQQLKIPLPEPPFGILPKANHMKRALGKGTIPPAAVYLNWQGLLFSFVLAFCLLGIFLAAVAIWESFQKPQGLLRRQGARRSYCGVWPSTYGPFDPFNSSSVRTEPPYYHYDLAQMQVQRTLETDSTAEGQHVAQKPPSSCSFIPLDPRVSTQSTYTRRKSLKPKEDLCEILSEKYNGSSAGLSPEPPRDKPRISNDSAIYSAGASLRRTPSGESSNTFLNNVRKKLRRLERTDTPDSSDSIDDTLLTACGAKPGDLADDCGDPSFSPETDATRERKDSILSGFVAMTLARSGALLAAPAGGAIGKKLLIQSVENESDMLHNILQSGVSRTTTREDDVYHEEKDIFVSSSTEQKDGARRRRA